MARATPIELYRNIIGLRPEMKGRVIFVTGDLIDPDILEFLAEINAKTLAKPLDINDVTRAVVDTLEVNA